MTRNGIHATPRHCFTTARFRSTVELPVILALQPAWRRHGNFALAALVPYGTGPGGTRRQSVSARAHAGGLVCVARKNALAMPLLSMLCALYLLSTTGLIFAEFLRPRAHPVFFVWLLFFMDKWIVEKSPKALAIALFIYFAANYWLLEFLPAGLLFLTAWFFYRPPVSKLPVVLAVAAGVLLWSPYLIFESGRNFDDLHCLLARRLAITNWDAAYHEVLTNPNLVRVEGERRHDLLGGPGEKAVATINESKIMVPSAPDYHWVEVPKIGLCYKADKEIFLQDVSGTWLHAQLEARIGGLVSHDGSRWFSARHRLDAFWDRTKRRAHSPKWLKRLRAVADFLSRLFFELAPVALAGPLSRMRGSLGPVDSLFHLRLRLRSGWPSSVLVTHLQIPFAFSFVHWKRRQSNARRFTCSSRQARDSGYRWRCCRTRPTTGWHAVSSGFGRLLPLF